MKRTLILAGALAATFAVNAQVQRNVMAEAFSNASCGPCAAQNPAYNALLGTNTNKVIAVKYQWYFPGYDPMNAQNPTEPNARIGYYGQSGVPCGVLDGTLFAGPNYVGALANLDQTEIDNRWAVSSPFNITLNPSLNAGKDSVVVGVTINTPAAFTGSNLKLHVLLVEKTITFASAPGSNGETVFHHVVRKMLPGSAGFDIQAAWTMAETQNYSFAIPIPNYIYDHQELEIVAFVQNNSTKEVHQAEQADLPVSDFAITSNIGGAAALNCSSSLTGLTVDFKNDGNNVITSASINYRVDGGTPSAVPYAGSLAVGATTPISIPTISGLSAGSHTLETYVTNVNGSGSAGLMGLESKSFNIFTGAASATPLSQAFTSASFPYANWTLDNPNPSLSWARVTTNSGSMKFDNFTYAAGTISNFIVEPVDISGLTTPVMTFDVAYRQYASENDRLEVLVSTDCGANWTSVFNEAGSTLSGGAAPQTSAFTPSAANWRTETVDLSAYSSATSLFIKFKATSAYGNNLYVDKINIQNSTAGIEDNTVNSFNVYPNPATDFVNVSFVNAENVTVTLINAVGQTVKVYNNVNTNTQLSLEGLASGVYVLNADINGQRVIKQIIKN
jgi:hypothetical protein